MRDLTSGPEGRLIFSFAVPMLIGNVFQQFYNMVDSMVVGQFVMPAMNFGPALSAFVGQNVGAGRLDRVRRGFRATLLMSGAAALALSGLVIVFRYPLIRMFNSDAAVAALGGRYLVIVGGAYVIFSTLFIANGLLRGAGDTLTPMLVTLAALWVVRIPAASLLSRRLGTDGVWLGTPIGWVVGMVLVLVWYAGGRWKRKALAMGAAASRGGSLEQQR